MLSNTSASRITAEPNDRLHFGPTCFGAGLSLNYWFKNTDVQDFMSNNPALMFLRF